MTQRAKDQELRAIRRLLQAVAANPEETDAASPHLVQRLRHRIASVQQSPAPSMGAIAWQMLPAMLLIMFLLCTWTGYETVRAEKVRQNAVASMLSQENGWTDALAASLLMGSQAGANE